MSWHISIIKAPPVHAHDLVEASSLRDEKAPSYAKKRFEEIRLQVHKIIDMAPKKGVLVTIAGMGETDGADLNKGSLGWSFTAVPPSELEHYNWES